MPRAAVLSINARVEGTEASTWEDPAFVQVWGPRYNVYVVAAGDLPVFTLGRLPDSGRIRARAEDLAARLPAVLGSARMRYDEAGRALGVHGNALRYAALTGTLAIRWEGARLPTLWTVPKPTLDAAQATLELARRYLNVFGPATPEGFARWAGLGARKAAGAFDDLGSARISVRTPTGDAWILGEDEPTIREPPGPPAPARLLPSGDAFTLGVTNEERALLVPDATQRSELWTPRVWPGAVLVAGNVVGTWRRAQERVAIQTWPRLSREDRDAVSAEAESLPLPGLGGRIVVHWD